MRDTHIYIYIYMSFSEIQSTDAPFLCSEARGNDGSRVHSDVISDSLTCR